MFLGSLRSMVSGFEAMAASIRAVGLSAERAAQSLRNAQVSSDPLWCVNSGEWPDEFVLLNRYLRTGVKAPFIFND